MNDDTFQEFVWCMVKSSQLIKVLVGVCYHSPSSLHNNNTLLIKQIKAAKSKGILTMIMGDFNYDKICWETISWRSRGFWPSLLFQCSTGFVPLSTSMRTHKIQRCMGVGTRWKVGGPAVLGASHSRGRQFWGASFSIGIPLYTILRFPLMFRYISAIPRFVLGR